MYVLPLKQRQRRAELKRQRYLDNPDQRLAAINRDRVRRGLEKLPSLAECRLRLPVQEPRA